MNVPKLSLTRLPLELRENFRMIVEYLRANRSLVGFRHLEITLDSAVTNYKHPHGLGFQPKDIVQTSKTGAGAITWNYDNFDTTHIDLTTTGACVVRAYVGTHKESA